MISSDKNLKKSLRERETTIGSWLTVGNTSTAEIMAKSKFDWLVIDMEHSAITLDQAQQLIQIVGLCGCKPLVRVGENSANIIKRVMDAGAYGVIIPMVNTMDDAVRAVKAVKYPPLGRRGVGLARAQGYGLTFEKYKKWAYRNSVIVVQIEHIDAIKNLKEILEVKEVDASIIGPYDLSASLGYPGEFHRKEVKNAITEYVRVCNKLGKPAGVHVIPPDSQKVNDKIKDGFRFIGFSLDTLFLGEKIAEELKRIKVKR